MSKTPATQRPEAGGLAPIDLLRKSFVVYGVMTAIGIAVMQFGHKNLASSLAIPADPQGGLRLVAIGGLGALVLLVTSYFFEDWFASFRELKAVVMRLLGPSTIGVALLLSFMTAGGEELLFRGAIQPFAGLLVTSIFFGLLHMGKDGFVSAWSLWALVAGLLIGWMYSATGSLWPCLIAHFGVNAISILNLRRAYQAWYKLTGGGGGGGLAERRSLKAKVDPSLPSGGGDA